MSSGEGLEPTALEPVDAATAITPRRRHDRLVDGMTDSLLADQGSPKRPSMAAAPRIATRPHIRGDTDDALRVEHGFSALVTVNKRGCETRVIIVLSHGHRDHVTEMHRLVRRLGSASTPVLIHPGFWTRRRPAFPAREAVKLPTTSSGAAPKDARP